MSVTNYMIIPQGSVSPIGLNIDDSWVRSIGSVAITGAAPATDPTMVVLTCTGGGTYTVKASDYCAWLFSNLLAGGGGGRAPASAFNGWCIARLEQLGVAIATIMNHTSRFTDR